jgi:hypothetical protein
MGVCVEGCLQQWLAESTRSQFKHGEPSDRPGEKVRMGVGQQQQLRRANWRFPLMELLLMRMLGTQAVW